MSLSVTIEELESFNMDIRTSYKNNNYTISVANDILENKLKTWTEQYEDVFYLIDENVYALYKDTKLKNIHSPIVVTGGESFKYASPLMNTIEKLLELGIKRNSLIVVIGGGATGDAGGMIASLVLRGVDYIHIPTTLLAHDSAIGGKTAINSLHGKNLIGSFYRPKAVIYDLDFLYSLSNDEKLSGFGEVFKHALLLSEIEVESLMKVTKNSIEIKDLTEFIISGIKLKMDIVTKDEHENGSRKFLNLGHTLGHAIEYQYKIPHGQAVMLGILFSLYLSNEIYQQDFDLDKYYNFMAHHGYPVQLLQNMNEDDMIKLMQQDKKNHQGDLITFILFSDTNTLTLTDIKKSDLYDYLRRIKETL